MAEPEKELPQLVIFDIAGTTVVDGGEVLRCFSEAFAEEGISVPPDAVNAVMGLPKILAIKDLLAKYAPTRREPGLADLLHDDFEQRMIDFYTYNPHIAVYPGVLALIRQLREMGVAVAVNTGFPRSILGALLDRLQWSDGHTLDASMASDESPRGRPYPDMVLAIMKRLGLNDPGQVAKVGDTPSDIGEGKSAGCGWVIGITHGSHTRQQLEACQPTHLVNNMAELGKIWGISIASADPFTR
ncbi:MAG: HAD family hydrolase [Isosphaeraceae bacterium]